MSLALNLFLLSPLCHTFQHWFSCTQLRLSVYINFLIFLISSFWKMIFRCERRCSFSILILIFPIFQVFVLCCSLIYINSIIYFSWCCRCCWWIFLLFLFVCLYHDEKTLNESSRFGSNLKIGTVKDSKSPHTNTYFFYDWLGIYDVKHLLSCVMVLMKISV